MHGRHLTGQTTTATHSANRRRMALLLSVAVLALMLAGGVNVVFGQEAATPQIQHALLEESDALRGGDRISADNPLRATDPTKARRLLERALDLPGPYRGKAATRLGRMLVAGEGGPRDTSRAHALFEIGVAYAEGDAANELAKLELAGASGAVDRKRITTLFLAAIRFGDTGAYFDYADFVGAESKAGRAAVTAGMGRLESAAEAGDISALALLGDVHREGAVVPENRMKAEDYYRRAAEAGDASAALRLAKVYANPLALDFMPERANALLRQAAEEGSVDAALLVACDAAFGHQLGFSRDDGRQWLSRAMEAVPGSAGLIASAIDRLTADPTAANFLPETVAAEMAPASLIGAADALAGQVWHPATLRTAAGFYKLAGERGDAVGSVRYARTVLANPGIFRVEEMDAGLAALRGAAGDGDPAAILFLAGIVRDGHDTGLALDDVAKMLETLAGKQTGAAARDTVLTLGTLLSRAGDATVAADGRAWLERAASDGSGAAAVRLAAIHETGAGVPRDPLLARYWLDEAAQRSDPDALARLAATAMAAGTPDDLAQAMTNAERLAALGDQRGGTLLAQLGAAEPAAEAALTIAADEGDAAAALARLDGALRRGPHDPATDALLEQAHAATDGKPRWLIRLARTLIFAPDTALQSHGRSMLAALADAGNIEAASEFGRMAVAGYLDDAETDNGRGYLKTATEAGWLPARVALAEAMLNGAGSAADPAQGVAMLEDVLAVAPDDTGAAMALARAFEDGTGVSADVSRATALYEIAAAQGSVPAMLRLARLIGDGQGANMQAERWLRRAASSGELDAILALGDFLATPGRGGAAEGLIQYRKAAALGSRAAMLRLGRAHLAGIGTPTDKDTGIAWLTRAAESGDGDAMIELAATLSIGEERRPATAVAWLRRSAEQGNPSGMLHLGVALSDPANPPDMRAEGTSWLIRAKDQNYKPARLTLETGTAAANDIDDSDTE